MLAFYIPYDFYNYLNPSIQVSGNMSAYFYKFINKYESVLDEAYIQEIYMKALTNYELINDIFIMMHLLIKIHYEIIKTPIGERKTYKEYLEDYHADCVYKVILCKSVDVKPLMIAFDEGYRNLNSIPQITDLMTEERGGISWFRIYNEEEDFYNDLIID